MAQLNTNRNRGVAADIFQNRFQRSFIIIIPQTEIAWGDATNILYGGGFNNHQTCAGKGQLAKMDTVPGGRIARLSGVLAHRRNHNAVIQRKFAQRDSGKKLAHVISMVFMTDVTGNNYSGGFARRVFLQRDIL
jgi:hypothetical protein